jgi:hypothetical protein
MYEQLNNTSTPNNLRNNYPFPQSKVYKIVMCETYVEQGASPFVIRQFALNDITLPDPASVTSLPTGLNSISTIYGSFHVQKVDFKYELVNNEPTFPLNFGVIFRDFQPSLAILNYQQSQDTLELGLTSGIHTVGINSGQSRYISPNYRLELGKVVGNMISYMSDIRYTGQLPAISPNQKIWGGIIIRSPTSSLNLTNGGVVTVTICFHVRCYSLNTFIGISPPLTEKEKLEQKIKELEQKIEKLILLSETTDETTDETD